MRYWLLKSEPSTFSIDDLARAPHKTTGWDGVRNFQARNFLREMSKGDRAFFYHSSCAIPGIAGTVTIVRTAYPDLSAFDPQDHHYDPKSDPERPAWFAVDVKLDIRFPQLISLDRLRQHAERQLKNLVILRRGNRLSVTPVEKSEWDFIHSLMKVPRTMRTTPKSVKK